MKSIKKIYKLLIVSFLLCTVSCDDDFLDVPPLGLVSDANFDPVMAVTSCYNIMGNYDNRWSDWRILILGDALSDDAWKGGSSQTDQIDIYQMNIFATIPSNVIPRDVWSMYYRRIFRFNWAIVNLQGLDQEIALNRRLLGEVKFLRAMHYFWLVRSFGDVPLVEEPLSSDQHNKVRESEINLYEFIERELLEAIDLLPTKSEYQLRDLGRATEGSARGLLSKVYLYQEKWSEALDQAGLIINSGDYQLETDFGNIFSREAQHGPESLFEITFAENDQLSNPTYHAIAQRSRNVFGGWGLNCPTKDLLDAFEPGDPRTIHTITFHGDITEGQTHDHSGYDNPDQMHNMKAFKPVSLQGNSANDGENFRVMRYAEILLIYAEAANELGQSGEALEKLNLVRERARNSSRTDRYRTFINFELAEPENVLPEITETGQTELREIIWQERRVELALEGDRFYDLVRQGRAGDVLRSFSQQYNADKGSNFQDGIHERFPVPQDEIDRTNGLIIQNNGY
ncbi:RagB/SusD family nutrient uptake outer membrane protein [Pleomorphovibrio marinus]|uniref:RagB/SusD family nutrient uptake outer membrane protein n=1 Tax=Pleomorphovibrio marinus TaxID=2164132 RepID=UPI000E0BBA2C|nr:RagB/SusD family nutrient uptake outer membrane protein [Pleomorphovibrio marinus]